MRAVNIHSLVHNVHPHLSWLFVLPSPPVTIVQSGTQVALTATVKEQMNKSLTETTIQDAVEDTSKHSATNSSPGGMVKVNVRRIRIQVNDRQVRCPCDDVEKISSHVKIRNGYISLVLLGALIVNLSLAPAVDAQGRTHETESGHKERYSVK